MNSSLRSLAMIAAGSMVIVPGSSVGAATGQRAAASRATPIFERELPNIAGKSLVAVEVVYPPGGASPRHRHPASAFIYAYVVSGAVVSAVDKERPRVYRAGESFYEAPGAHHRISRNVSRTKPATMLAVFVKDSGKGPLVFPDAEGASAR